MCKAIGLVLAATAVRAFVFDLEAKSRRCFTEELTANLETNISYVILPGYAQLVDVKITDANNVVIHDDPATDRGYFAVTSPHGGDHAVCFYSRLVPGVSLQEGMKRAVSLHVKAGDENQNYRALASKEHLKPMEMRLRIIEDGMRTVHSEYEYYKEREIEMRNTNEHMNAKVMWMNVGGMAVFAIFAYWQATHLKKYFKRKRMID